jgi:hypothetical protein
MAKDSKLWNNITQVIDTCLEQVPDRHEISPVTSDRLNQLKCHLLLHGKKLGLKSPIKGNISVKEPLMSDFESQALSTLKNMGFKTN